MYTRAGFDFVRSGHVSLWGNTIRNIGTVAHDWSRTAVGNNQTYTLRIDVQEIDLYSLGLRWGGFPVRCLVILVLVFL